ncbi:MAG: PilZ domain-containing protein [Gammaproteobacteria bacterium]|nr:PilZ domain-containing protein [Gammaproteobacteria bacterium]MDH5651054.1 PilZ domain-containing protein [Gammaproteobacteria bacterium]
MQTDKRMNPRVRFERPARITSSTGEKSSVRSYDFSMQGAGFTGAGPHTVGERLSLVVDVGQDGASRILKIHGRVVHQQPMNGGWLIGMQVLKK